MADYIKDIRTKVGHAPLIMAGVIGILTDQAGRVLLQQRSDFTGEWGLISGTIEYGEPPAQTMVREFKEETNLEVEVVRLLGVNGNLTLHLSKWRCCPMVVPGVSCETIKWCVK